MIRKVAGILLLFIAASANAEPTTADKALASLRALEGTWEGTFQWTGKRTDSGKIRAVYHLTGAGSAVIEDLYMGDTAIPSMSSVYHLDGADLRMTHYCAAQNQPRFKASQIDDTVVKFSFVDSTNLQSHPGHVEAAEIRPSADRVIIEFTFTGGSVEHIEVTRAQRN